MSWHGIGILITWGAKVFQTLLYLDTAGIFEADIY